MRAYTADGCFRNKSALIVIISNDFSFRTNLNLCHVLHKAIKKKKDVYGIEIMKHH